MVILVIAVHTPDIQLFSLAPTLLFYTPVIVIIMIFGTTLQSQSASLIQNSYNYSTVTVIMKSTKVQNPQCNKCKVVYSREELPSGRVPRIP